MKHATVYRIAAQAKARTAASRRRCPALQDERPTRKGEGEKAAVIQGASQTRSGWQPLSIQTMPPGLRARFRRRAAASSIGGHLVRRGRRYPLGTL